MVQMMEKATIPLEAMDTVLTSLSEPTIIVDKEGAIIKINEAALELLEANKGTSKKIDEYFELAMEEMSEETNFLTRLKQNEQWVQISKSPLNNTLTLLVLRRLSLTGDEDYLEYAMNHSDDIQEGFVLFYENEIIDCNFTFAKLFRYPREELRGKKITDVIIDSNSIPFSSYRHKKSSLCFGIKKDKTTFPLHFIRLPSSYTTAQIALIKDVSTYMEYERN